MFSRFKFLTLILSLTILISACGQPQALIVKEDKTMPANLNKKVLMIIASKDFKDEEYFTPRQVLEQAGAEVKVASDTAGIAQGVEGGEVAANFKLSEVKVGDFDALVFVGGPGAVTYLDNSDSYRIAQEAISQDKILAAICISPTILAKAGVLQSKKATVWTSALDKSPKKILEENGAIYQAEKVVVDGKIITANGPAAAQEFGQRIVGALNNF